MSRPLLLFSFLLSSFALYPCGNEYAHTWDGKRIYSRYFFLRDHHRHFDTDKLEKRISSLNQKVEKGEATFKTWSDLALNLMKLGEVDSALSILEPLALEHPEEYNILANLGTCYELSGRLDSALKYISLGLEKNPNSHRGSEWIHVKILEAKIKEQQYPGWINTNEIVSQAEILAKLDSS